MSHPIFISVYSNGHIWVRNNASEAPTVAQEAGTLVTCLRVSSDCSLQKVASLTGSGNASASALADSFGKGTGAAGSKFTVAELT